MKKTNSLKETKCTVCEANAFARFEGTPYCKNTICKCITKVRLLKEQSMTLMNT